MKMVSNLALCVIPAVIVLITLRKLRERSWGYCRNTIALRNKIAIVTGANSGIGYEVAKELAARSATVILACRNLSAAQDAILKIQSQLKSPNLQAFELDLASLKSIKEFATAVLNRYPEIHLLINNAGVAYPKTQLHVTEDGFEAHMGINHLGHFHLTNLLLESLKRGKGRVIVVSSTLHEKGRLDIERLATREVSGSENLYANSKLANVYFANELARRVKQFGVEVYALCPGWTYTKLFRHSIKWYHYVLVAPIAFFFMRSAQQGSQTVIFCATETNLESGGLYRNCGTYKSKITFDEELAVRLWDKSQLLVDKVTL